MKTIIYLVVMPGCRKPKAVPPRDVAFFRQHARKFYEARGMSADEARKAIADGGLAPTYENGKPVGQQLGEHELPSIEALSEKAWEWIRTGFPGYLHHARLWIGSRFATPQNCGHGEPIGTLPGWHWHWAAGPRQGEQCDALYEPGPFKLDDLTRNLGKVVRLSLLVEDHEHGTRTSDVGRPWFQVEEWTLTDGGRLQRIHL